MGKLVIDGNKVYTVDEDCMKSKNLTLEQIQRKETGDMHRQRQAQKRWNPRGYK